jgi:hypothetical protein
MINATSNDVIIHITFEPATVKFNGNGAQDVFIAGSRGFCYVEFSDGESHPISHPLEDWIIDARNRFSSLGTIYFKIDPPGERSNDGQDLKTGSVTNIQTSL